jgi:hypothetical protein
MNFVFGEPSISGNPQRALELVVTLEGKTVRVDLERSAIQHFLGPNVGDDETLIEFVHRNRKALRWTIEAHLIAHGVPLDRHLVITLDDLRGVPLT